MQKGVVPEEVGMVPDFGFDETGDKMGAADTAAECCCLEIDGNVQPLLTVERYGGNPPGADQAESS